ncbi:MAG: PTS system mannose/fructose/sorbose family transporter subunit IID [Candidatus Krumholzibacteria bacterium]|nr:PTS system mannose/fructose/sorbose family transporter subunit IID [Candidatus Krumholzibacteria bacterium]
MVKYHWNQLWRLFLVQSSRNNRTVDGLGFFHVLSPLLGRWAGGRDRREDIAERHIGYFNANPILASYVAGVVVNLEERRKAGEDVSRKYIERVKSTLSSVSTARGDYFFKVVLIPLGLTIGSIFAIYGSYIGLVIFLALYNFYHFRVRIGGYLKGVRLGEEVAGELATHLSREQGLLGGFAAFASGAFAALVFARAYEMGGARFAGWGIFVVALALGLRKRLSFSWSVMIVFLTTALFLLVW